MKFGDMSSPKSKISLSLPLIIGGAAPCGWD